MTILVKINYRTTENTPNLLPGTIGRSLKYYWIHLKDKYSQCILANSSIELSNCDFTLPSSTVNLTWSVPSRSTGSISFTVPSQLFDVSCVTAMLLLEKKRSRLNMFLASKCAYRYFLFKYRVMQSQIYLRFQSGRNFTVIIIHNYVSFYIPIFLLKRHWQQRSHWSSAH